MTEEYLVPRDPLRRVAIYRLEDDSGSILYVGKTIHPQKRFTHHCRRFLQPVHLHILDWTTDVEWQRKEQFWIKLFRSIRIPLVNQTAGGQGIHGRAMPAEQRAKIGLAHKGKKLSAEHRQKLRIAKLGKHPSKPTWSKGKTRLTDPRIPSRRGMNMGRTAWNKGRTMATDARLAKSAMKLKGKTAWNKDLTKETDKRVAQYGVTRKRTNELRKKNKTVEDLSAMLNGQTVSA
jgi:hypothetical protein